MPKWSPVQHRDFPDHLRAQMVAVTLAVDQMLPDGRDSMMQLANAVDALKRSKGEYLC